MFNTLILLLALMEASLPFSPTAYASEEKSASLEGANSILLSLDLEFESLAKRTPEFDDCFSSVFDDTLDFWDHDGPELALSENPIEPIVKTSEKRKATSQEIVTFPEPTSCPMETMPQTPIKLVNPITESKDTETTEVENSIPATKHVAKKSKKRGEKFRCDKCEKEFTKSTGLIKHRDSKHNGLIYICEKSETSKGCGTKKRTAII